MKQSKNKFEPAVHLGLLVIIFVLLFLNFRSNLTIYDAGVEARRSIAVKLNNAAISISRTIQKERLTALTDARQTEFIKKHRLSDLWLWPSTKPARNTWRRDDQFNDDILADISGPELLPGFADAPSKSLMHGGDGRYFYKYTFRAGNGTMLLVLAETDPELAYLEDSSKSLILVNLVAVAIIIVLYLVLFRLILSPFRRIKRQAINAGRRVDDEGDAVDAMVDDYRRIIEELQEKEAQLLELNQAIQAKADRLELFNQYLLRSMSSGVVMVDRDGRIISMNKAAGSILAVDPDDYANRKFDELPGFLADMFEPVNTLLADVQDQSYNEYDVLRPDDTTLSLGITVSAIQDYTSNKVGASVLINDLTETRSLRGEAETKNRLAALGEMASGLAHQLRNSIGAMSGYSHLVKKRLTKHNLELDSINALEEEAHEAERLVDRFLKFARPFDLVAEKTDMVQLVHDLVETFEVRPENAHVKFLISCTIPESTRAEVDGLLMKQAMANIIENAINAYHREPGQIVIELSSDTQNITVQIRDDGCGIPAENLQKIFTPFFSSRPSGTGLGLPLAKKIIDLHRGRLKVDSSPGKGTAFTITLPLCLVEHQVDSRQPTATNA